MAGYRIPPGPLAEEMMRRLSLEDGTSARTLHAPPQPIDAYTGRGLPMGLRTVADAPEPLLPLVPAFPAAVPPGVNVDDNIKEAFAANFALKGSDWFYDKVRSRGPWDYKQLNQQYQDFGNFNYGATGAAFGFSQDTLLRMAGWAQVQAGTSKPEWGMAPSKWDAYLGRGGISPFGDDPRDQAWILRGIEHYRQQRLRRR